MPAVRRREISLNWGARRSGGRMGPLHRVARALNRVPSAVVLATIAAVWSYGMFQRSATAAVAQPQSAGAPRFELDKSWPHVPEKWKLGFISSVTVDSEDHVWVLHRPRTLPERTRPRPRLRCWSSITRERSSRHGEVRAPATNGRNVSTAFHRSQGQSSGSAETTIRPGRIAD